MKIINNIEPQKKFDVTELLKFLASELKISDEVELMLFYNPKLLNALSTKDVEYNAILQNPIPHHYTLMLRDNLSSLHLILCHEMIHLKQYESGLLKQSSDFKTMSGKGIDYDCSKGYFDREGEEEAFTGQTKLGRKFKKQQKLDKE